MLRVFEVKAWIKEGQVLCASQVCNSCTLQKEYGCVEATLIVKEDEDGTNI